MAMANEFASPRAVASCARWLRVALRGGDAAEAGGTDVGFSLPPPLLFDSPDAGALLGVLADGRLLRRLLQRLRQSTDGGDAAADDDAERLPAAEVFLASCASEFHVPPELLFQPGDLSPGSGADGVDRVVRCLHALSCTDAAAAAGFKPLGADNIVCTDSGFADGGISGGVGAVGSWDAPVLGVIDHLIGFFRDCRVLARELRESPLSLWPLGAVQDVFGPTSGLLALLTDLRAALRSRPCIQPLDEALAVREVQLTWLYAGQNRHMHLTGGPTLDALVGADGRCASQVTSALAKMPQMCPAKSVQDLQLMPDGHVRQLTQAAKRALDAAREGPRSDAEAVARLERALSVLRRVAESLSNRALYTRDRLKPSHDAFISLTWPSQLQPPPRLETLGRLQHQGSLCGPDGKRVRAILWDRALVLAAPESGEVLERLDITQGMKFVEVNAAQSIVSIRSRRWSFSVTVPNIGVLHGASPIPPTTPATPPKPRSFACDSAADRMAWLAALERAWQYSFPGGFDRHRHCFRRVAVAPDGAPRDCRQCGLLLRCWAHRCDLCQFFLHRKCVIAGCGGDGTGHLSCRPVPTPRNRSRPSISSLQQPQEQQSQQQQQHSWYLPEPLDAEDAKSRLMELRRQGGRCRNFLMCPSSASSTLAGYQLHVLSDTTVTSYDVETVEASTGEAPRLRIAESDESFASLAELARHYSSSQLPLVDCQEDDEYSSVGQNLVFDSSEVAELPAQAAGL